MAYSFETYYPDGTVDTFAIPFPYLKREHIVVRVNNLFVGFSFINDALVKLDTAPTDQDVVIVQRITPVNAVPIDFSNRGRLNERSLDLVVRFYLYAAQEVREASQLVVVSEQADLARRIQQLEDRLNETRYDLGVYVRDTPFNGTDILRVKVGQDNVFLPINLVESSFSLKGAPVGVDGVLTLKKNDTAIGTVTFPVGSLTPVVSFPAAVTFGQGDLFSVTSTYPDFGGGFFGVSVLARFFYPELS